SSVLSCLVLGASRPWGKSKECCPELLPDTSRAKPYRFARWRSGALLVRADAEGSQHERCISTRRDENGDHLSCPRGARHLRITSFRCNILDEALARKRPRAGTRS